MALLISNFEQMINLRDKGTPFSENLKFSFNGKKMDFSSPKVMGILNITPDSFYTGSRYTDEISILESAEKMIEEGAYILDIGGFSSRPGAADVNTAEEVSRVLKALRPIRLHFPETILSVDTFRAETARIALQEGADMVNDISGGNFDADMIPYIVKTDVPYIIMHIKGKPADMQLNPEYTDVVAEVGDFLKGRAEELIEMGHRKIILDPGFGFGKTVQHNFKLLNALGGLRDSGLPVMAGLSRKSMINKVLGTSPADALNGTTVLNTIALIKGADILRVHDVRPAMEAVRLVEALMKQD